MQQTKKHNSYRLVVFKNIPRKTKTATTRAHPGFLDFGESGRPDHAVTRVLPAFPVLDVGNVMPSCLVAAVLDQAEQAVFSLRRLPRGLHDVKRSTTKGVPAKGPPKESSRLHNDRSQSEEKHKLDEAFVKKRKTQGSNERKNSLRAYFSARGVTTTT